MAIETTMAQQENDPNRIVPHHRRWRFLRTHPHPDYIAITLIIIFLIDFIERGYDLTSRKEIDQWKVAGLIAVFFYTSWAIYTLARGAIAYHESNPWTRRGYHQHKFPRKTREHHNDVYYHDHDWAFPFHRFIFYRKHR